MKRFLFLSLLGAGLAATAWGQDISMPKPSPTTTVKQEFSTSAIEITYSRPSVRGREIFGHVVPFGKVWRTGANEATKITFGEDIKLEGTPIPAGTYALYTIPGEKEWKIILNKGTGNWGTAGFDDKDDVAQITVPATHTAESTQSFRISIENITINSCAIVLSWANTQVSIPVTADNDARIMAYLDKELQGPKPPYQQAASYYLETNKNLDKAMVCADKAIAANPKAFYLHWLKARICQEAGNHTEAVAEAKKAAEGAAGSPFADEYQQHYLDIQKGMDR